MFLTSTSDIVRVNAGSAVTTIGVQASWVDSTASATTPGRTNTAVTGSGNTTVVASPAGSTTRTVNGLRLTNNHATSSNLLTIQHYDGTTSTDLFKTTLYPGEALEMNAFGTWRHLTVAGAEYDYSGPTIPNLGITGTLAESLPRNIVPETNTAVPTASGTLWLQGIYLKAGTLVSSISFFSATTAAGTPTNQFFALYSRRGQLLAQSANDTSTAWAANTIKTLAMGTAYRVQVSDIYYLGLLVTASTVPTTKGLASNSSLTGANLNLRGVSTASLTTTLPDPCALPTASSLTIWGAVT